jgi:hypothetical protein
LNKGELGSGLVELPDIKLLVILQTLVYVSLLEPLRSTPGEIFSYGIFQALKKLSIFFGGGGYPSNFCLNITKKKKFEYSNIPVSDILNLESGLSIPHISDCVVNLVHYLGHRPTSSLVLQAVLAHLHQSHRLLNVVLFHGVDDPKPGEGGGKA